MGEGELSLGQLFLLEPLVGELRKLASPLWQLLATTAWPSVWAVYTIRVAFFTPAQAGDRLH